jgi:peroxiredoxin
VTGASFVAITPQLAEHSLAQIEERKLPFELTSDPGNATAESFGLRWTLPADLREVYTQFGIVLPEFNGDESWTLPVPARYILDGNGTIQYARSDPDYTVRPEPEETLEALRPLLA